MQPHVHNCRPSGSFAGPSVRGLAEAGPGGSLTCGGMAATGGGAGDGGTSGDDVETVDGRVGGG